MEFSWGFSVPNMIVNKSSSFLKMLWLSIKTTYSVLFGLSRVKPLPGVKILNYEPDKIKHSATAIDFLCSKIKNKLY